jgi:type II secretory pathway pseudopilin PulG
MSHTRSSESGFTLAGLIVMMTVIAVTIAYTVPKQWSLAVGRDRDQQTLFAMKQYARAIRAFQEKNHTAPVSIDQLSKARSPRFLRGNGELLDPLTGKLDWIVIPAGTPQQATGQPAPGAAPQPDSGLLVGYRGRPNTPPPQTTVPVNPTQAGQPGGFTGPMIGVRPNKTGTSYIFVNGSDSYEQWSYTINDLDQEINQRRNAVMVK